MIPALLAAIAMVATDVTGTIMVVAEAHNRGWLAGVMDSVQWLVGITTTAISVTVFQHHSLSAKVWVVVLVTMANLLGTKLGTFIGHRLVKDKTVEQRLAALEAHVSHSH